MTAAERKNAALLLQLTTVTPFTYCLFPSTYKCLFCEEKHPEVQAVLEHSRKHEIPDSSIILRDYIKRGKRKVMVDISKLNCRLCDATLSNLEDARKHLTETHNAEFTDAECGMIAFNLETTNGYFQCHICLKSFYSFFLLNKHISVHYSNVVCESCGKSFVTYQRLAKHKETHKTGSYPCEDCNKTFPSKSKLKYHYNKVHGNSELKLAKCQKCQQRFEHHYEKIKHLKEVHGMEFNFKCELCSDVFKTKHSLNMHTVSCHLQSLTCLVCQKTFNKKYVLKRHMAVHFLPRNYSCPLCKKWFRYEKTLKQHLKDHNSE